MTVASASSNKVEVVISENGQVGLPGIPGTNGAGFNAVKRSLIDNAILHILKKNKLNDTASGLLAPTRSTIGTSVDRYNLVTTAAINIPREEINGWLVEKASTNILIRSEEIDDAAWVTVGGASVVGNANIAPDGNSTAETLILPNTNDAIRQSTAISATSKTFTFSIWLKGFSGTERVWLSLSNVVDDAENNSFFLTTEWARYEFTKTFNSTVGNVRAEIINFNPSDDSDCMAWGAQVEESRVLTSYIKTVSSSETRTEDVFNIPSINNFPLLSGSWSVSTWIKAPFPLNTNYKIFSIGANSVHVSVFETGDVLYQDGGGSVNLGSHTLDGVLFHIGVTYNGSEIRLYIDGVLKSTNAISVTSFDTADTLHILKGSAGNHLNGNGFDFMVHDFELNSDEFEFLAGV